MATYLVSTGPADDDLPIHVDDSTRVTLDADNSIVIRQERSSTFPGALVTVTDVDALTRALTQAQLVQAERFANDTRPMTDDHRRAIFAALFGVHGTISRQRRLGIISAIVRRPVLSLSTQPGVPMPLTRAEATHVLDVLNA